METVKIGNIDVSRLILGSNPFSGFSHQGREMDLEMMHYWTYARIKEEMCRAESLGVNTIIAIPDRHMWRLMMEYRDEGGKMQWFGQTDPGLGTPELSLNRIAEIGAPACHIHGGYADGLMAKGRPEDLIANVEYGRRLGLTMGLAGHNPDTFRWAEGNLDVDYYMCSYYNPGAHRGEGGRALSPDQRYAWPEDRRAMTELIQEVSRPVIHYKVMAAGRNDPAEAFGYVARSMRPGDAVCVGIYTKDKPDMLKEDAELLEQALAARDQPPSS